VNRSRLAKEDGMPSVIWDTDTGEAPVVRLN